MNTEPNSPAPAAATETPPSQSLTTNGLGALLKQNRQARASAAAGSAATPTAETTPAANGSDTAPANASRQPAKATAQVRTDDTNQPRARAAAGAPASEDEAGTAGGVNGEGAGDGNEQGGEGEEGQQDGEQAQPGAKPKGERTERRISKLVSQLKQKDAEIERLRAGGQQQPQAQRATESGTTGPLADIDQQIAQTRSALAWLRRNPDGGEVVIDGRKTEITAEAAQKLLEDADVALPGLIARREMLAGEERELFVERQKEAQADIAAHYPWMTDREAPEFQEAVTMLSEMPRSVVQAMKAMPDAHLLLADMLAGRRARMAKATAQVGIRRTAPTPRPTPQPGASTAAAPRVTQARAEAAQSRARFASSGRTVDLAKTLSARRRAARSVEA